MGFESLNIGTQAMKAAQGALSVIGHNIANVNTEGYTRQRANLETNVPLDFYPGQRGTGVHIEEVQRLTDEFTRTQLELENQKLGEYSIKSDLLREIEQVLNEPGETGLQQEMSDFFNSFHNLANQPEEFTSRNVTVSKGTLLAQKFAHISRQLKAIQTQADQFVEIKVDEINSISRRIADLNKRISSVEVVENQNANDLRDERELLVRDLNKLINVTAYEDENKNLLVESQGAVLVAATQYIPLQALNNEDGFKEPYSNLEGSQAVQVLSGEMRGILDARDYINDVIDSLDDLSSTIINQVNRVHSQGSSLEGHTRITGNTEVVNPAVNLVNAGYENIPTTGSFYISATNESTGDYMEQEITVDPYADSLNDIITRVNTLFGGRVVASLTGNNELRFESGTGYEFQFVEGSTGNADNSDFLMANGVNTFFSGNSSFTMEVRDELKNNVNLITAGRSLSPGDNTNAIMIADLANQLTMNNSQETFNNYYASIVTDAGATSTEAIDSENNQDALVELLKQRHQATTGVSIDEEAASLLQYQQMYQAAAKYVSVMNSVMDTLINGMI